MEKVLDRKEIIGKGNQLFLEEYFSLDGMLQPHDNHFCSTAVAQSFETQTTNDVFAIKISRKQTSIPLILKINKKKEQMMTL